MLHTDAAPITKFLDELIDGQHSCCLEAATRDWASLFLTEKYNAFFVKLVVRVCNEEDLSDEAAAEASFVFLQILIAALSIGTLCGTSLMSQAHKEIENAAAAAIEKLMRDALKSSRVTFMKPGPKEKV